MAIFRNLRRRLRHNRLQNPTGYKLSESFNGRQRYTRLNRFLPCLYDLQDITGRLIVTKSRKLAGMLFYRAGGLGRSR